MATAVPFVKLLRQLAAAKDDYRTGALDISWEEGKATLFLVFGQPNHAVLETVGGPRLEGTEALTALVRQLPTRFEISPWRKEVVRTETLACSLEELMEPFAQMAGAASPGPMPPAPHAGAASGSSHGRPDFGLADFPLLPLGPSLWADASAAVVHLDLLLPSLPDALVVLTGPKLRAAAVVVHQRLFDAVWIEDEERTIGEAAAMALMGAREGSVSGYRLETPQLAEALTMLWRCPTVYREMPATWVNLESMLADLTSRRRDSAIVVTGGVHGVALIAAGALVGVYTENERRSLASPERLVEMLRTPGARLTLRQSPEAKLDDHLPEAAYHAFVEDHADASLPPRETLASISTGSLTGDPSPAPAGPPPATAPPPPPATADPISTAAAGEATPEPVPAEPDISSGGAVWPSPAEGNAPPPSGALPAWGQTFDPIPPAGAATANARPLPGLAALTAAPEPASTAAAADFEGMKADLIQIGSLWLGSDGAGPVIEMIQRTKPYIDDVMATIEAIKHLELPGHEPSVVQAMTREMHYHAAEYLSGL